MLIDTTMESVGFTWYNWLEIRCAPPKAIGIPITAPSVTSLTVSPRTSRRTWRRWGAKRHSDTDLSSAVRRRVGNQSVQSDGSQCECEESERRRKLRDELFRRERCIDLVTGLDHSNDCQPTIDGRELAVDRGGNRCGISCGPDLNLAQVLLMLREMNVQQRRFLFAQIDVFGILRDADDLHHLLWRPARIA